MTCSASIPEAIESVEPVRRGPEIGGLEMIDALTVMAVNRDQLPRSKTVRCFLTVVRVLAKRPETSAMVMSCRLNRIRTLRRAGSTRARKALWMPLGCCRALMGQQLNYVVPVLARNRDARSTDTTGHHEPQMKPSGIIFI